MKSILLSIMFAIVAFMAGCNRCDKKNVHENIDPADKFVYQITDKLVYKNNFGGRDTFEVTKKRSNTAYIPYEGKCSDVGRYIELFYCDLKDSSYYKSSLHITSTQLDCTWWIYSFHSDGGSSYVTILPEYQLNGITYKNVYFFTNDSSIVPIDYIGKAYISKSHGVLSIIERNGTIWEFEKLITSK